MDRALGDHRGKKDYLVNILWNALYHAVTRPMHVSLFQRACRVSHGSQTVQTSRNLLKPGIVWYLVSLTENSHMGVASRSCSLVFETQPKPSCPNRIKGQASVPTPVESLVVCNFRLGPNAYVP